MNTENTTQSPYDAAAAFQEQVAKFEQAGPPAAQVQPNATDVEWINSMHRRKDAEGRSLYANDSAYRQRVEAARFKVFAGESIADIRKATEAVMRGETPAPAQPPTTPAVPTGTPQERAFSEIEQRFEAGDVVTQQEYPEQWAALTAGYKFADLLPEGFGVGPNESFQLEAARQAGVSEAQIRAIVKTMVKAQQEQQS